MSMIDLIKYERYDTEPFAACEDPAVPHAKWLLEKIEKPKRVLDVGCGTGIHTSWFNENGMECIGVTINPREIEKRVHPNVREGNMLCLPFVDSEFDLVFCLGTLEHTVAPFVALCEFNRVLKNRGHLFVDMPEIRCMEIHDPEYRYHKSVLFPIQVKDLLLKSNFDLIDGEFKESCENGLYTASPQGRYLAVKKGNVSWLY